MSDTVSQGLKYIYVVNDAVSVVKIHSSITNISAHYHEHVIYIFKINHGDSNINHLLQIQVLLSANITANMSAEAVSNQAVCQSNSKIPLPSLDINHIRTIE